MNRFVTMPGDTIPNDQQSFRDFCYGSLPSEKNIAVH